MGNIDDVALAISEFAVKLKTLPTKVIMQTKLFIADYIASALAGYEINHDVNVKILTLLDEMGGVEESDILFGHRKYPACNAAFINAFYSHGADIDDGNKKAAGHIGTHVISSVFALAQTMNTTWREVFLAINVGYEVFNRIAGAVQPSLYKKGFHSTGVVGSVAASAACAKLLGLDTDGIYSALSLGALQSSGLLIIDESGQACKPLNPANAARTGVMSAQMAQLGIVSPQRPFESCKGWFNAFADNVEYEDIFSGLDKAFTICESYLKIYPSCRHTHSAIEAGIDIHGHMVAYNWDVTDIRSVNLYIYPSAIKSTGAIRHPVSVEEAKFSLYYNLAVAIMKGDFTFDDLKCGGEDIQIGKLIEKIEVISDPSMENREAGIRGCRLEVCFSDGTEIESRILNPKGEMDNALDWKDMEMKLKSCAMGRNIAVADTIENVITIDLTDQYTSWIDILEIR